MEYADKTTNNYIKNLRQAANKVFANTPILFAYLYGSRATGKARPKSDFDIAVYFKDSYRIDKELNLAINLERASGLPKIDLRSLNNRTLSYQGKVVHDGILIYSADENARINFERKTLHMYLDFHFVHKKLSKNYLRKVAQKGIA